MSDQLNIDGLLTKLNDLFAQEINRQFHIIGFDKETVEKKIPSKFGYKVGHEVITYKIEEYKESEPIKWGFTGENITLCFENSFDRSEFIVPDREAMDLVVKKSTKEFEAYVAATLAKMTLLGHTIIYYPVERNPNNTKFRFQYYWTVDDSCISPKGNCVSHILLHPIFAVAKEISRKEDSPF